MREISLPKARLLNDSGGVRLDEVCKVCAMTSTRRFVGHVRAVLVADCALNLLKLRRSRVEERHGQGHRPLSFEAFDWHPEP